jgi:hypothetical protein
MTIKERSCYTCRWARGSVCDRPHLSEDMDMAIDDYAMVSGCHRNKGLPLDRSVICPGHERGEHLRKETK